MFCGAAFPSNMATPVGSDCDMGGVSDYRSRFLLTRIIRLVKQTLTFAGGLERLQDSRLGRFSFAETFKPFSAGLAAKPGQLPFCIMAHIKFCLLDGAGQVAFPLKEFA